MKVLTPYYEDSFVTLYNADMRDVLLNVKADVLLTDPLWPNLAKQFAGIDSWGIFRDMCRIMPKYDRAIIQLGPDSDPAFLQPMSGRLPFIRAVLLRYKIPGHHGTLLRNGDLAYIYGERKYLKPGTKVMPGEYTPPSNRDKSYQIKHPCPRNIHHVRWLIETFTKEEQVIIDPFSGSGTTLLAARELGRKAIGVEIRTDFCEEIVERLQRELPFERKEAA